MTIPGTSSWHTCAHSAGCAGIRALWWDRCLAHLDRSRRSVALLAIAAGSPADFRGVSFTAELFEEMVNTTRYFHQARFDSATFLGDITFSGPYLREEWAASSDAVFIGDASFTGATFKGKADFHYAAFRGFADFDDVTFEGEATFDNATFSNGTQFSGSRFLQETSFVGVKIVGNAEFKKARFEGVWEGVMACSGVIQLRDTTAESALRLQLAASDIDCTAATFKGPTSLQLRHARIDLTSATLGDQVSLVSHLGEFELPDGRRMDESNFPFRNLPRVVSLRGVNAAQLTIVDLWMDECRFFGARNLDQIRIEGECFFAGPDHHVTRMGVLPFRWSRRVAIADEHQWRARHIQHRARSWNDHDYDIPGVLVEPAHIASLYRQLRKALEDSKFEPGAADFYYGEMEMRRRDYLQTSRAERWLLHLYWLVSGYGLRASRALGWLAVAIATTILLMMGLGLPDSPSKQSVTGVVPPTGSSVSLQIDTEDPTLRTPVADRFTSDRADAALRIVLNSVIFRASPQSLTTWGTYTEMVSRFSEPVLLGLAALAIRGRIKRG